MRRQPVTRDEVRFNGRRITTMPIDSVSEGEERWQRRKPIAPLWAPLLRALNRKRLADWKAGAERRTTVAGLGFPVAKEPEPPIHAPHPSNRPPCTCRHCGREFYRTYRDSGRRYCSDICAAAVRASGRAAWRDRMVAARSQARAEARAERTCLHCGEPIESKRSTRQYCNDAHRIAAYRKRQQVDESSTAS
jgi:hypothetical protein